MTSPPTESAPRTPSGPLSIGSVLNPRSHAQYQQDQSSLGYSMFTTMPTYSQTVEPHYYGSEGSYSPASDRFSHHRHSISEASSVAGGFEPSLSPVMTSSMPGWLPATATSSAPPMVLPSNVFEEGQTSFLSVSLHFLTPIAPLLRLISLLQSIPCQYTSANWTDMSLLRYNENYPQYPDSYSIPLVQSYQNIYDQIV